MKKVVSLLLAVVLVFSMATAALAMDNLTNTCNVCGYKSDDLEQFTNHMNAMSCAVCKYCNVTGLKNGDEIAYHQFVCRYANIVCDYCGDTYASESDYADHIAACKKSHLYIPIALIFEHVKAYFGKINFTKAINDGKSFFGYVGTIGGDIIGAVK